MSEFVLIKNADGSGQMLLRVAEIVRVEDSDNANVVVVRGPDSDSDVWLDTASTAAEVLEAIREVRALGRPSAHFTSSGMEVTARPPLQWLRSNPDTYSATVDWYCTCKDFSGQHEDCPTHGKGTAWHDLHGGSK